MRVGIRRLSLYIPLGFVEQTDLETLHGVPGKYTKGLEQVAMGVWDPAKEDVQSMALTAVRDLRVDPAAVGYVAVGTETLVDKSKSLKTVLMQLFPGNDRVEGVTHVNACYGGTAALLAACAWVQSDAWDGRLAVVVACDTAEYDPSTSAVATGGAGAVAMLVGPDAALVLEAQRSTVSKHVWDFYKPEDEPYPRVQGKLSQDCYLEAVRACWGEEDTDADVYCFHAPYSKLVRKAAAAVGIEGDDFAQKVQPGLRVCKSNGNMYTASLYGCLVAWAPHLHLGQRVAMFSYGSGYVATLFFLRVAKTEVPVDATRLDKRVRVMPVHKPPVWPDAAVLESVDDEKRRYYTVPDAGSYATSDVPSLPLRQERTKLLTTAGDAAKKIASAIADLPMHGAAVDYEDVLGRCCERVVGCVGVPVGVAGPLRVNGRKVWVPMATTEGALVASTNRGCKALSASAGVTVKVTERKMTRAPVLEFPSLDDAFACAQWVRETNLLAPAVEATSRFTRLQSVRPVLHGRRLHLMVTCTTGDAMGMNSVTKAARAVVAAVLERFPDTRLLALSGNLCSDKKASAELWSHGRGCSVTAEAYVDAATLRDVLKVTSARALCTTHRAKVFEGSVLAGSHAGAQCHAANVVAAVFVATGQDVAQTGTSSACLFSVEEVRNEEGCGGEGGIRVTCTMPCIEVGAVGGGTHLRAQAACRALLGERAEDVATGIVGAVLAAELSLLSALCTDDLLGAHMRLGRKP